MLNDFLAAIDKNIERTSDELPEASAPMRFPVGNKESAGLIMRLRVQIMEHLQELDLRLLGQLEQNPEDDRSLRDVSQHIRLLMDELNSLKLILGGESVLGSETKHLKVLFQHLDELLRTFLEQGTTVSERIIQICYSSLHLLRIVMGFPGAKKEVDQSIGDLMDEIIILKEEQCVLSIEPVKIDQPEDTDSNEGFARLIDLLGELMMSRRVFNSLSRQALLEYNLPTFSQEIKATGNRLVRIMENLEDTVLGLSRRYTKLVFRKRRVLPFESGGQAFFLDVNQVLEVLKVPKKYLFQRWGHFFCHFRGETVGLVFLSEFFGRSTFQKTDPIAIIVITDGRVKIGVGVEKIAIEQDVLVKPLPDVLVGQREIEGAAIMEDGRISLMLDGVALIQRVSGEQKRAGGLEHEFENHTVSNNGCR